MIQNLRAMRVCLGFLLLALALPASAQIPNYFAPGGGFRAGRWDAYVALGGAAPRGLSYENVGGSTDDVSVAIDTYFQGGVGVGYNFNQFWNLNFEMQVGAPDYSVSGAEGTSGEDTVYLGSGRLNLDWNLLPGNITPVLSTGVGFVTLTVDDPSGGVVCYPDYWWGYVCYTDTRTEAAFTWNVRGGLRADFANGIFVKALAGVEWWLLDGAEGIPYSVFGTLSVGMSFR